MKSRRLDGEIQKAQRGDHAAFACLYEAYKGNVYRICLRMLRITEDAEDLTQEVFVQLYRRISTFRGEAAFTTWLHRLTVNSVLMKIRRRSIPTVPIEEPTSEQESAVVEFGCDDLALLGVIDRVALEQAVSDLPPGYRLVFVLHDIEGYEHAEIADILGCTAGNCKSQLHKARLKLRSALLRHMGKMPPAPADEENWIAA